MKKPFLSLEYTLRSGLIVSGMFSPALLTAILIALTGCSKPHQQHTNGPSDLAAIEAKVQTVESRKSPAIEEVVGTFRARLRATLEAKTSGRVLEMPVVLGQRIKAGELVARLDAPEVKARFQQAEANLQQAEREWKRVSALHEQQAATRADYEAAEARHLTAQAAVAEARALLGYVEIQAPFDAVVTRKWADVGDLAAPGKPLVEVEDPARLQLEADVPEALASSIQPNAEMKLRAKEPSIEITGTVAEIAPVVDPASRTLRVKLDLPPNSGLISGQFARLMVPIGETTSLRIPSSAVVQRGQMEIVFAVENQRARLHLVRTGRRLNDETEILSGLDAGDSIVVNDPGRLVDGQPLQVK
jgi:RND family efflux transporter MFP subunit